MNTPPEDNFFVVGRLARPRSWSRAWTHSTPIDPCYDTRDAPALSDGPHRTRRHRV